MIIPYTTANIPIKLLYILHLLPRLFLLYPYLHLIFPPKITPPTPPNPVNLQLLTLQTHSKPPHAHPIQPSYYPHQSTLHPIPPSPSIPPLTLSSPPKSTQNHTTNTTKPCKSTATNPPIPVQSFQCSSHTPQLISLSIYSASYTSFPVYSSYNPIFTSKIHSKSHHHQHYQTM